MIWHHIKAILNYWRIKKANATPEQIVILKLRIDAARENHSAGMLKNNDLFAWSNEHYQEITPLLLLEITNYPASISMYLLMA